MHLHPRCLDRPHGSKFPIEDGERCPTVSHPAWELVQRGSLAPARRMTYCWTSFSISDRKLGPSGRSRQRGWRCIIGHTLWGWSGGVSGLTRLTLVCEVIRYRLVQVRQNLKKESSGWRPAIAFLCLFLFHIVREVLSVRERDTERERETEVTSPFSR